MQTPLPEIGDRRQQEWGDWRGCQAGYLSGVATDGLSNGKSNATGSEPGTIIITDFFNRAMPFVRYTIGDMAIKTDKICSCGRGFELIEKVVGRTIDKMIFSDGTSQIPCAPIAFMMVDITGIQEYQVVQYKKGEIEMLIVPNKQYTPDTADQLMQSLYDKIP